MKVNWRNLTISFLAWCFAIAIVDKDPQFMWKAFAVYGVRLGILASVGLMAMAVRE